MEELLYWIIEYIKVMVGYGVVLFVWPSIVFRKYLKGKSVTFRFGFCTTVQVVLINSVVLLLGLVHLLNKWTVCILFYGILLWSVRDHLKITEERQKRLKHLVTGTLSVKQMFYLAKKWMLRLLQQVWRRFWGFYKVHWLEYTLLLVAVIYGMVYFSWGAFQDYSYGFGDMYVHHSWIYGLIQGQSFSAGVYPEAMHCVIYSIHTLLGVEVYSCMLFMAGIHIAIILVAAYCLMKEVFQWRFSPIFVLILFLTLDVVCVDEVFSMSRLQWTLPQDYGYHTIYLCGLFLIRYLKSEKHGVFRKKETKGYWDENLLLFIMALAASIAIHFYITIMAFFVCVAIVVFALKRTFCRKRFLPLVAAVLLGLLIAVIPMGVALASGIPFQGSIGWAMNVINGTDTGAGRTHAIQSQEQSNTETQESAGITENTGIPEGNDGQGIPMPETDGKENVSVIPEKETVTHIPQNLPSLGEKVLACIQKVWELIKEKSIGVYKDGYVTLYQKERADWILGFTCLATVLCILYKVCAALLKKIVKTNPGRDTCFSGYLPMILASVLFMVVYAAPYIGLPELIAGSRLCSTEQMLILMVMIVPIDLMLSLLGRILPNLLMQMLSLAGAAGLVAMVWLSGSYHGYLYYELTRYNAAVRITNEIMEALPENTYTIVSTTDEIYQVIQKGRHEELLTFLTQVKGSTYHLPTEYVFIFVEKAPIRYAHNHFFSGPDWLAMEKYPKYYSVYSECPEILSTQISEEAAESAVMYFSKPSRSYSEPESRTILESKAYQWCERFEELYPNEMKLYYEDEDFVCYYLKQNTQFLYDLELE